MRCPKCGKVNRDGNLFCEFCGTSMRAETVTDYTESYSDYLEDYIDEDITPKPRNSKILKAVIPACAFLLVLSLAFVFAIKPAMADRGILFSSSDTGGDKLFGDETYDSEDSPTIEELEEEAENLDEGECEFLYDQEGYSKVVLENGDDFNIPVKEPSKSGHKFDGWKITRADGKYSAQNDEWVDSSSEARTFEAGESVPIDSYWTGNDGDAGNVFVMTAEWESTDSKETTNSTTKPSTKSDSTKSGSTKSGSTKSEGNKSTTPTTVVPTAPGNEMIDEGDKIVSAQTYNSTYKNDSRYKCTKLYRYATRSKQTTTSGYDTLSGYTKYDSKTSTTYSGYRLGTPISTSTSYSGGKKTTVSASDTGYYYYAYAAANPSKTSDWSFVCGKSRSSVVSYMKQNYSASSAWSESNLRYFWYITSSDLGSNPKGSQISRSIPYCSDSTVGVGTLSKSGTHYYDIPMYKYSRCYKVKTVTTTNYFYKWSSWSAWSDWTANPPAAGDTVKIDSTYKYLVQKK